MDRSDPKVDVSILIVCYRSRDYIADCLRSVSQHVRGCHYEVLLVDCSNDGTCEFVSANFPNVRIVDNVNNLGFAKGNNLLAEHASGEFLILLNPDTTLTDDAISEVLWCAEQTSGVGAVGGRARLPDGSRDPGSRQVVPTLFRYFVCAIGGAKLLNGALAEDATDAAEVETLSGAFMLVPTSIWREMNGLDSGFFAYSEELDLCCRIRAAGYKIVMTPKAEIVHLGGGGEPAESRVVLKTKAQMHFLHKHWSPFKALCGGALIWLHAMVRCAAGGPRRFGAYRSVVLTPSLWWSGFSEGNQ